MTAWGNDFYRGTVTVRPQSPAPILGGIKILGNRCFHAGQAVVIGSIGATPGSPAIPS